MKYQISINKMATEDDYNDGEVGMTQDYGEVIKLHVEELANAPLEIAQFLCTNVDELRLFENHIEWQTLETGEGYQPTGNLKALWQEGECKLYNAYYRCDITEVWSNQITNKELLGLGMKES